MAMIAGLETETSISSWAGDSHQSRGASHPGFFHELLQTPNESLSRH